MRSALVPDTLTDISNMEKREKGDKPAAQIPTDTLGSRARSCLATVNANYCRVLPRAVVAPSSQVHTYRRPHMWYMEFAS